MFSARLIGSCPPVSRGALGVTRSSDVGGLRMTTASRSLTAIHATASWASWRWQFSDLAQSA